MSVNQLETHNEESVRIYIGSIFHTRLADVNIHEGVLNMDEALNETEHLLLKMNTVNRTNLKYLFKRKESHEILTMSNYEKYFFW